MVDEQSVTGVGRITIQEDFGVSNSSVGCSSGIPWWKDLRQRMRNCLPTPGGGNGNNSNEVLVEVKQVGNCCRAKGARGERERANGRKGCVIEPSLEPVFLNKSRLYDLEKNYSSLVQNDLFSFGQTQPR